MTMRSGVVFDQPNYVFLIAVPTIYENGSSLKELATAGFISYEYLVIVKNLLCPLSMFESEPTRLHVSEFNRKTRYFCATTGPFQHTVYCVLLQRCAYEHFMLQIKATVETNSGCIGRRRSSGTSRLTHKRNIT